MKKVAVSRTWMALLAVILFMLVGGVGAASAEEPPFNPKNEIGPSLEIDADVPNSRSAAHVPASHVPRPASSRTYGGGAPSLRGLNFADQRLADEGRQFSLEPPDQGLCVGDGGYVLEAVNDAFAFYQRSARASRVMALNPFFTKDHAIVRSTPPIFGTFISDPKCYFDPALHRFFFTVLSATTDPATGSFTGPTHVELAVSKTAHPNTSRSDWHFFRINTTNGGASDPADPFLTSNPGCPCLGDQPLIGADRYGFYVSTNEFTDVIGQLANAAFNGALIYAMDKASLAAGQMHNLTLAADRPALAEGPGYSIQPATSPTPADWQPANSGTEYLMSALDFDGTLDNRIAVWGLTNTKSLKTTPALRLTKSVVSSEVYGQPPAVEQKTGPTPLGDALPTLLGKSGKGPREHENLIDSNDDRMQQAIYVRPSGGAGFLASGLNTVVKTENGPTHAGIAWFVVQPTTAVPIGGTITRQGYTAVNQNNVIFPAIGLNHRGQGGMVFTLVGRSYYPSAAFTSFTTASGAGRLVHIPRAGRVPADGFTGYRIFGGNGVERWGDYSAATAGPDGTIWMATEYIEGDVSYPPFLANWDTRIIRYNP